MTAQIKVLLVDDSAVIRGIISRGISGDPAIKVVGAAGDGRDAIAMTSALSPDVVVLDVEMPVMDGLAALPKILEAKPGVVVIMASALTRRHAGMSFKALQLGASDYVPKPDAADGASAQSAFFQELLAKIKAHGLRKVAPKPPAVPKRALGVRPLRPTAIAIGSSTGGPTALLKVFARAKTRGVVTPVFITQHMPPTFTALFAEQLGQVSGATAMEGADGARVQPGVIYVAPGGKHMLVRKDLSGLTIQLSDGPPEHFCKPAVDPMLRSLASAYGGGLLAAIFTGMGRDGADGCVAVANAGGSFIVQDEASSVVYGMPGAAMKTGRAMAQLSLDDAAEYLSQCMGPANDIKR